MTFPDAAMLSNQRMMIPSTEHGEAQRPGAERSSLFLSCSKLWIFSVAIMKWSSLLEEESGTSTQTGWHEMIALAMDGRGRHWTTEPITDEIQPKKKYVALVKWLYAIEECIQTAVSSKSLNRQSAAKTIGSKQETIPCSRRVCWNIKRATTQKESVRGCAICNNKVDKPRNRATGGE